MAINGATKLVYMAFLPKILNIAVELGKPLAK